jgi:hypothetical protein
MVADAGDLFFGATSAKQGVLRLRKLYMYMCVQSYNILATLNLVTRTKLLWGDYSVQPVQQHAPMANKFSVAFIRHPLQCLSQVLEECVGVRYTCV